MHDFVYNELKARANDLELACRIAIDPSHKAASTDGVEDSTLRIAFVGQYNAGKSSLVKMLTGIEDIAIGSNVTTERSKEYTFKGLRIVDTPGIQAGYCVSHDEEALRAISKADLLVFVITNELFDELLKAEFRKLCFEHHREKEILLVINKAQNDPGTEQTKLDSIAPVLHPLIPESLPIVFTDASSYFDALDEDNVDDRDELLKLSNRDGLIAAVDAFAAQRGLYARLTTPLQGAMDDLLAALEKMQPSSPLEGGAIALMKQVKRLLLDSRRAFEKNALSIVDKAHTKIVREGSGLASLVGGSTDAFDRTQASAIAECRLAADNAVTEIQDQLQTDLRDLEENLDALAKSPMAKRVMEAIGVVDVSSDARADAKGPASHNPDGDQPFDAKFGKSLTEHAKNGLALIAKSAVGNSAKEGLKGVSGSTLHGAVKKVGELIGYKFKAWEAVKIADYIGKGAKFLGPVMAIAGVGMQIYADRQESVAETKMTAARRTIRSSFQECADATKLQLLSALGEYLRTGYDAHIESVDEELKAFLQKDADQSIERQALVDQMNRLTDFLQEIREKSPWG